MKPLDLETQIRVPQQYVKTRIYYQGITEETAYLLTEWLSTSVVHGSVGFPEITVPIVVTLRRSLKSAKSNSAAFSLSKEQGIVKTLLERIEESAKWVEAQRKGSISPGAMAAVSDWEQKLRSQLEHAPLSKYLKVQLKAREKRRKLLEKVRHMDGRELILQMTMLIYSIGPGRRGRDAGRLVHSHLSTLFIHTQFPLPC